MADRLPGSGWLGWLGRQVGHVKKAIHTDVTPKQTTVYRQEKIEEAPMPDDPNVKLRRTTIDEVVIERNAKSETRTAK